MDMHSRKERNLFLKRQDGVVAVEFVILFPLFLLIIAGIVEFGHLFYVRHTLTNASREGARAAVVYYIPPTGSTKTRGEWAKEKAKEAVDKYLLDTKFWYTHNVVFPLSNGSASGEPFGVTVTSPSGLLILDTIIPAFDLSAETTMRME